MNVGDALEGYSGLPVNARLVAALRVTERVAQRRGVLTSDLRNWLEHMWTWLTVDEDTFSDWNDWSNPVLEFGLGGDLPADLGEAARASELEVADIRSLIEAVTEIVYGHLFAAIEHERNLRQLRRVAETAERLGVRLPDATFLAGTPVVVDGDNGWGARLSGQALEELRAISYE